MRMNGKKLLLWLLVGVLALAGMLEVIQHVPPDAVHLREWVVATGRTVAARDITYPPTVADYYGTLNSLPSVRPGDIFHCPLYDPATVTELTLTFTRQGMDVEDATLTVFGCLFWMFSRGGAVDATQHYDPTGWTGSLLLLPQPAALWTATPPPGGGIDCTTLARTARTQPDANLFSLVFSLSALDLPPLCASLLCSRHQ
jgi:hypothetical protein